ncbi:MAG: D-alanyl-D-alanine carboxypeptidase family protein [Streptococcaceae bacterium]|jgi:D-alanyl-D-alanine carboxypeptidase|nr:D-alanyl-D-alanine carboxypeptidase family protein [Streptococcaceae bacterium]
MPNNSYPRRRPRKTPRYDRIIGAVVAVILLVIAVVFLAQTVLKKSDTTAKQTTQTSIKSKSTSTAKTKQSKEKATGLPNSKVTDWDLVLVNRDNPKEELNPDLTQLGNIWVDSRIATAAEQFLVAAQAINPKEHFISGYRSVAYQKNLHQQYVEKEMAADPSLTEEAAEKLVQTYSQPAGMSEHQTGLAIDLSDVDSLNESTTATEIAAIAPQYGFVLRFTDEGKASTGVGHEDWHFRYVGVENAKYMTDHHLTLEEYLKLLK